MDLIVHITPLGEWLAARVAGEYRAESLATEGFIHCSRPDQVVWVANERFVGMSDLLLLLIDADRLDVEVVHEDCYETGQAFPHIYGPLPMSAVVGVVELPAGPDGRFPLPPLLAASTTDTASTDAAST